jgi:hypothetical protein
MATVDSDKVVCEGIHAMIVAVLVIFNIQGAVGRFKKAERTTRRENYGTLQE